MRKPLRKPERLEELPSADDAMLLFRTVLDQFRKELSELENRREWLVGSEWADGDQHGGDRHAGVSGWQTYQRDYFRDEEWVELCRSRGEDPEKQRVVAQTEDAHEALGVLASPPEPLTTAIGVAGLIGGSRSTQASGIGKEHQADYWAGITGLTIELVNDLHPDPEHVDWEQVAQKQRWLRQAAINFAKLVRGGRVRRGPGPEEVPAEYLAAWAHIRRMRSRGASEAEIEEHLRARRLTGSAIRWLRGQRLDLPSL
jgi:hypothetical protein